MLKRAYLIALYMYLYVYLSRLNLTSSSGDGDWNERDNGSEGDYCMMVALIFNMIFSVNVIIISNFGTKQKFRRRCKVDYTKPRYQIRLTLSAPSGRSVKLILVEYKLITLRRKKRC